MVLLMGKPESKVIDLQKITDQGKAQVFIEDLTPEEQAKILKTKGEVLAIGLVNLGNTCYMNSAMQVLHKIPELKDNLQKYEEKNNGLQADRLIVATKGLFSNLDNKGDSFEPQGFLQSMFSNFPQFKEMDKSQKAYRQQDVDEYFQLFISTAGTMLPSDNQSQNLMQKLFEFQLTINFVNKEDETELTEPRMERLNKLTCIIDNNLDPINNLQEGIKIGLNEEVEKHSVKLDKNCVWMKKYSLKTLPKYLIVQKIRFVWREKDINTNTEARKAKILRNVAFPKILDLFEFCEPELQKNLDENRKMLKEQSEREKEEQKKAFESYKKEHGKEEADSFKIYKKFKEDQKVINGKKHDERLWRTHRENKDTGNYELISVITHKGRSTDSGHYVSWCQSKGDKWFKFDDDLVTQVNIEDILNLRGGGDWHMAYYLMYRKLQID